jgi:hypothetical protein
VGVVEGGGQTGACTGGQIMGSTAATGGGGVAQPPSSAATPAAAIAPIADNRRACTRGEEKSLGWVFLEIGLALAIAVAIVWWTLPRKPKSGDEKDEP